MGRLFRRIGRGPRTGADAVGVISVAVPKLGFPTASVLRNLMSVADAIGTVTTGAAGAVTSRVAMTVPGWREPRFDGHRSVSYTHLTLPTNREV